jgi:hypothetical protein
MATSGGGSVGGGVGNPNSNVIDLLKRLNLTEEEEVMAEFSDEEEEC